MHDPRLDKLANVLTTHSTKIQPDEFVLIEGIDIPQEMVIALIRAVRKAGGIPLVELKQNRIQREIILGGEDAGIKLIGEYETYRIKKVQAYIGIRGSHNITEMSDVPSEAIQRYQKYWLRPLNDIRVPKTKWVVLRWPHPAMAQQAKMSTEVHSRITISMFAHSTIVGWNAPWNPSRLSWKRRMKSTSLARGPICGSASRTFPLSLVLAKKIFPMANASPAPVRDSVNGTIHFNTPTIYQGTTFTDIRLRFENGKIVEATANNTERLNDILDTDEGARYIGEFAIAFNPYITNPMLDILFDEKIAGSFHFTPGQAYEEADNGVRSAVHWDMVMIQTPEYGGGEMSFDGNLIRKDGRFVHSALEALNPEHLV